MNRVAAVAAVVLFSLGLLMFVFGLGDAHLIEGCTLGGFTAFAAAHAL